MIINHSFIHHFTFTITSAPRGHCSPTGRVCIGKLCRRRWLAMIGPNRLSGPVPLLCTRPYRTLTSAASVSSCTSGSETRFSPGSQWVLRCWPGEPSPGPTGISGGWTSSPVRELGGVWTQLWSASVSLWRTSCWTLRCWDRMCPETLWRTQVIGSLRRKQSVTVSEV